ncbi:Purine-cytosine permease fcy21 [Xanthoria calcicola]
MGVIKNEYDVEGLSPTESYPDTAVKHISSKVPVYGDEKGAVPGESFTIGDSLYARIQRFANRFGVEPRGIERVPEDERTDRTLAKAGTMWLAANMVVSSFAIGVLAVPVFHLGFVDALLTILFINLLGITPVCFFSTFGPVFGLRQMVLSRFYYGWYGVKVIAVFNILACVGWSSVNVIVGAQLLHAVNNDIPGFAGIIIIAAATFLVTLFGYKIVHYYEFYSWIPCFIIFLIVLGEFAHSGAFVNIPMGVGGSEAGAVLSFASSVFGFATGWTSYAADYTVYQPHTVSRVKTFAWTWGGLIFPLLFTETLGLAVATAMTFDPETGAPTNSYAERYEISHIGGLLAEVLFPPLGRFGQFCLVVLALSIIANNCPNIYSVSLSLQVLGRWTQAVPRFIWTFVGTLIYVAISIPGYSHFESVLENFMLLIGYWLAIYEGIALAEHFIFKRGIKGYNVADYTSKDLLPPGIAAILAFCFGVLGAVMGMAQVWFIGPIGKHIGNPLYGGDVGFPLAFGFAFVSYVGLRTVEKRKFGR